MSDKSSTQIVINIPAAKGSLITAVVAILIALTSLVVACSTTADTRERDMVQNQQEWYRISQPVPFFERSLPRYMYTEAYRAMNKAYSTYSYVFNPYTEKISDECASIGYPFPGGTQLTNPEQLIPNAYGAVIPQAEPDGLFKPAGARATIVMCLNDDGTVSPRQMEEDIRTYPYPMEVVSGKMVRVKGVEPSFKINPNVFTPDQLEGKDRPGGTPITPRK